VEAHNLTRGRGYTAGKNIEGANIMQIERVHGSGAWNIYGIVNGYLLSRTYFFIGKREAIKLWKEEASA